MTALLSVGSDKPRLSASEDSPVIAQIKKWANNRISFRSTINVIDLGNDKYRVNAWERRPGEFCDTNRIRQSWYLNVVDGAIIDKTIHPKF